MTIEMTFPTSEELRQRLASVEARLGLSVAELRARHDAGVMTAEEWAVWDEVESLQFLLA